MARNERRQCGTSERGDNTTSHTPAANFVPDGHEILNNVQAVVVEQHGQPRHGGDRGSKQRRNNSSEHVKNVSSRLNEYNGKPAQQRKKRWLPHRSATPTH